MSKRNIAYIKPQEPNFLRKIKEQVGYKEGPTLDTKRQEGNITNEDLEDTLEEQPTVVVLQEGDLTAEEVERHQQQLEKEEEEKPADLSSRITFKVPSKKKENSEEEPKTKRLKKEKTTKKKTLLSFDEEENDD